MTTLSLEAVELGELLVSLDGYEFRKTDSNWKLNRNVNVLFHDVKKYARGELYSAYIDVLSQLASTRAALTVQILNYAFRDLLEFAAGRTLDANVLIEFRQDPGISDSDAQRIRILFRKWFALNRPGVDARMIEVVRGWLVKGQNKGDAVKRLHPEAGPFTDLELQGFIEAAAKNYELEEISITELAIIMVLQSTGRRPWQLMNLRLKDLIKLPVTDGFRYFVNVPRIKQEGGGFRQEFRKAEVIKEVWDVLKIQRQFVIDEFANQLGKDIPSKLVLELPLFFAPEALRKLSSLAMLERLVPLDSLHIHRQHFNSLLSRAAERCGFISERTDRYLSVFARRFRYTLGTRAAREGFGVQVIAELLDHSNTLNAHVYTLNVPEHGAHIDAVVGKHLTRYAHAFAGTVVDDKTQALRGSEPGSDIRSSSGEGTGTCGHGGLCRANVPVPCYTCAFFQPWLNGPHEEFHAELLGQRQTLLATTGDAAVATALDRTILAIAEVIDICEQRKKKLVSNLG